MRIKKPRRASLDEVKISRGGESAIIEFADPTISTSHIKIGPHVDQMSDKAILAMFNDMIAGMEQLAAEYENIVVEIPPGQPQITYSEQSDQWVPRGDLLRCVIEDGGPDGEVTVYIDDHELSLREFGRLLVTHAGWGMGAWMPGNDLGAATDDHLMDIASNPDLLVAIPRQPPQGAVVQHAPTQVTKVYDKKAKSIAESLVASCPAS